MDQIDVNKLPFRNNVANVIFRGDKFLIVQKVGWPDEFWKFPQGGIGPDEKPEEASARELKEELGSSNFRIVGKSRYTNQYDFSEESLRLSKYQWRGQIQQFFIVEFLGNDEELSVDHTEVRNFEWVDAQTVLKRTDHDDKNFTNYKNTLEKIFKEYKFIKI